MKKIYIVLTCTGTMLSNIIKCYTDDEYTHVSISLDKELEKLYSFGRLNPYNALYGGFVHEGIDFGTFKRFKNTKALVYEIEISDEAFLKITDTIEEVSKHRKDYKFNMMGLVFVAMNKKRQSEKSFYCAEFVKYVLEAGMGRIKELPDLIKPEDFKKLKNTKVIYKGLLRKYNR